MIDFTQDELNLMMLYSPGSKSGLCKALEQMKGQLTKEEKELSSLVDSVLGKLSDMEDDAFNELNLYPNF